MRNRHVLKLTVATIISGVALSAAAQPPGPPPPPEVTFVTVTPKTMPVAFDFVGITDASKVVEVRSRVQGFLEARDFEEGARIEEGTTLFRIDARPFEADLQIAKARVAQAESRLRLSEQEVHRLQSVSVPGAIAESDLDQKVAEQSSAQASLSLAKAELAKADLELSYTEIEAPLTGYIGKAIRDIGSLVDGSTNSLLAEMQQVDPIYVSYQMTEREYLSWRHEIAEGGYVLDGVEKPFVEITLLDGTVYPETGALDFEGVAVNVQTGSVEMRATLPNPDRRLKPGQFVKAYMRGYVQPDAIAIPQRAVSASPQGSFVYVLGDDNKAELRIVKAGKWSGRDWIIDSGLKAGEKVLVEGLVKVQPGIVVNPSPAGASPDSGKTE